MHWTASLHYVSLSDTIKIHTIRGVLAKIKSSTGIWTRECSVSSLCSHSKSWLFEVFYPPIFTYIRCTFRLFKEMLNFLLESRKSVLYISLFITASSAAGGGNLWIADLKKLTNQIFTVLFWLTSENFTIDTWRIEANRCAMSVLIKYFWLFSVM